MAKNEPLSVAEVAEQLGVTDRAVRMMIESGRLKAKNLGRDWVIMSADVDAVRDRPGRGRPKKKAE
jgi:excisionase family DNA binding protein